MSVIAPEIFEHSALYRTLERLDLRLRLAVDSQRSQLDERAKDPFRGLYVSDSDVDDLLSSVPGNLEAREKLLGPVGDASPRLRRMGEMFGLDEFEQEALLICIAPEIDLRYERLYSYLQDDVSRRRPSVDLILRLLATAAGSQSEKRDALGPGGRLFRLSLLVLSDDTAAQWPLLARPLRVDERVVEFVVGSDRPDARIAGICRLFAGPSASAVGCQPSPRTRGLERLLNAEDDPPLRGMVIYLRGPATSDKVATLRSACLAVGKPLVLVDLPALLASGRVESLFALAARETLLQDAVLGIDGWDRMRTDDTEIATAQSVIKRGLSNRRGATVLLGEGRWEPAAWTPDVPGVALELEVPAANIRLQLWSSHLGDQIPAAELEELAGRYRLDGDAIRAVTSSAHGRAIARGDSRATSADFRDAAQSLAAPPLDGLARRVVPRYGWDDIILPPDGRRQLRELCDRARHQHTVLERWGYGNKHSRSASVTGLFGGQPGTGKSMAAEIVAGDLGLLLYRIDLSAVVSKYIGETEKNLEQIFRAADRGDAVLLFDEADALFGKRSEVKDAHDRFANIEIAYLLQRLEAYEGIAILTTNLLGNIDEAFLRRLDCVMEFPMPEEAERLSIWQLAIPADAPLADEVDLGFLARKFRLAGGHIRNIALTAGYLAAADGRVITMKQLVRATRREYQKLGKLVAESDFEQYYPLLKGSDTQIGS